MRVTAVKRAIESYTERFSRYNPQAQWVNEDEVNWGFSAKGAKLNGHLRLLPHERVCCRNQSGGRWNRR